MTPRPFQHRFGDLPRILPVFPLSGVLLLPGGLLPLNVFEPRYLAMVEDALGWGRVIGMVQPVTPQDDDTPEVGTPKLYSTGCAGRISHFAETDDGRLLVTLTGECRFRIVEEVDSARGYRRVTANWEPFRHDVEDELEPVVDRVRLLSVLRNFGRLHGMDINWKAVEAASDMALTISLPMACPFEPSEKQALLECPDASARAAMLITLMEMAVAERGDRPNLVKQ